MMKIRNFAAAMFMAMAALLTSCGEDEYKQIYLYDTETKGRITDGNDVSIHCYREHKFIVRGGSGGYHVDYLEGGNVAAEWGAKDTLKLTGNFPIKAFIRISDDMDNSVGMGINVEYLTQRYTVDSLYSEIQGDYLTMIEVKDIQKKIDMASALGTGSTFIFIYDDEKDPRKGQLRITDKQSQTIRDELKFKAEPEMTIGNTSSMTYQKIYVYDKEKMIHEYVMIKEFTKDHAISSIKMREDVKDKFKNEPYYSKIDSAILYYDVTEILQN